MPSLSDFRLQYGHILRFTLLGVASLSIIRLGLVTANFARLEPKLLLRGLRFDLILIGYLCAVPCLISMLSPAACWPRAFGFIRVWYRLALFLVIAMEFLGFGFLVECRRLFERSRSLLYGARVPYASCAISVPSMTVARRMVRLGAWI